MQVFSACNIVLHCHRLTYPNALSDKVEIDYHQKLTVKFQIKNKQNDEVIRAQQAFLRFTNKKSNKEVIYLAEATSGANPQYKVDVVSDSCGTASRVGMMSVLDKRRI